MKIYSKYVLACQLVIVFAVLSSCNNNTQSKKNDNHHIVEKSEILQTVINTKSANIEVTVDTGCVYNSSFEGNIGELTKDKLSNIGTKSASFKFNDNTKIYSKDLINEVKETTSKLRYLSITFDNDIFDNTDYYYTNGINILLVSPLAQSSPSAKLLVGIKKADINIYGLTIKHNMYTPTNPETPEVIVGDRPFSAFLTIGNNRSSYHIEKRLQLSSEFNFGVLGPASLGGDVQNAIHELDPVGWQNQIQNSIIVDYTILMEKGLISTPNLEANVTARLNAGTLYNKISGGLYLRAGKFLPVYRGPVTSDLFQYWFFIRGNANFILYDATLQGGIFNNNNAYTINNSEINRYVVNASIGFAMYYSGIGVEFENFYLSPEFKGAYDFRFGRLKLIINI